MKINGIQAEFRLCRKHKKKEVYPLAWGKVTKRLERLEKTFHRGKELLEETCILCRGSGELNDQGQCWWCGGKGVVKPNPRQNLVEIPFKLK